MNMLKFKSLEDAQNFLKEYIENKKTEDSNFSLISLLSPNNKEIRLNLLLSIRPFISKETMEKYDYNELAIFNAVFHNDFEYRIPVPTVPDVTLTDYEMNWFDRLIRGGIQTAHILINNNSQVNLVSLKKIYCYAVHHGYAYNDKKILQMLMVMASPFLSDRIKKEECFDPDRIFYKTFLPEYYNERYTPLDCLDVLYCINDKSIKEIFRKAEIKEKESKWESSKNGILIDGMIYEALDKYMSGLSTEQKLETLVTKRNNITTESPLLSIYYGHKKMVKALKHYNLKSSSILNTNEGRWIYHHVMDMYMTHLDKEDAVNNFQYFYQLRKLHKLPEVECLKVYKEFKDKQQMNEMVLEK